MLSVFIFSITFCYHIKNLLIVSNFLKIDKAIVSNWHQNLDKLIRECVRFKVNISQIILVTKILYLKNSKKHKGIKRKYKDEMEGVHDNASAFMNQNIKINS